MGWIPFTLGAVSVECSMAPDHGCVEEGGEAGNPEGQTTSEGVVEKRFDMRGQLE